MNNLLSRGAWRWRYAFAAAFAVIAAALAYGESTKELLDSCFTFFLGSSFMPHGSCYLWQPSLVTLHASADSLIALSYFSIPAGLIYYVRRRPEARFGPLFLLFGAFICLCGMTHLLSVFNIWNAAYWTSGWVKVITGIVSALTAVVLLRSLPVALRIPLPDEMRRVTSALEQESSAREIVERQLRRREDEFEAVLKGGLDAFYMAQAQRDADGGITDFVFTEVNDRAAKRLGVTRREMVGQRATALFPSLVRNGLIEKYARAIASGEAYEEELQVSPEGEAPRWFYYQCVPTGDTIAIFSRDITVRKEEELELIRTRKALENRVAEQTQELWKSESRYKLLTEFIYTAVWHTDEAGAVRHEMPSWTRLTGQKPEDSLGYGWLRMYAEEDREHIRSAWKEAIKVGDYFQIESRIWSAAKSRYIPVLSKGLAIKTQDGAVAEWIGALYDLSEYKKQEETLANYARRLSAKNKALQEFSYVASHDLQETLRKVRVYGEMLQEDCGDKVGEEGNRYISVMRGAADRMSRLLDDLLSYSRASSQELRMGPVSIRSLAEGVALDFEIRIQELNASVTVSDFPEIDSDASLLRVVLQNLISNGLKYHRPDQPPRVEVSGRYVEREELAALEDSSYLAERYLMVEVRDDGIGFDPRFVDRIFKPFQRLHTEETFSGTGIGLAICHQAVERLGGFIRVETTEGAGATFRVYLPAL